MVDFAHLMLEKGKCCICSKPLKDSKHLNLAQLDKKAAWKFPVWNSVLLPGLEDRVVAVVCDGCHEAKMEGLDPGPIKYVVEACGEEIILHDIEELEDVEPIEDIDEKPDIPDFFTGSVKDQRHGFYGGLN